MQQSKKSSGRYLAEDLEGTLTSLIVSGKYVVGDKLPTVDALCDCYGVSRTVVREAIAGLRTAGLVQSRRGSGVFVRSREPVSSVNTLFGGDWPARLPELVDALELRAAVEVQAASLASTRASTGQVAGIIEAHNNFIAQVDRKEEASGEDFAFHIAISRATNNKYFENFLSEVGKRTIPRENLLLISGTEAYSAYLEQLVVEHEYIIAAIEARDPDAAKEAMRKHLLGSLERYRKAFFTQKN